MLRRLYRIDMILLRKILKIFFLLLWSLFVMLPAALSRIGRSHWRKVALGAFWAKFWARGAAKITGVKTVVHGVLPESSGKLLISNHLGYLDVLAHASVFNIRFAPKAEIKNWFLFGTLVSLGSPVWIDRKSPRKSREYAEVFRETLEHDIALLVYPEGTSTDGKHGLLSFKSTPFAALPEGCSILPTLLFYHETPADSVPGAWFGDISFAKHVWNVLGLKEIRIDMVIMPEITALPGEQRKELANRVHEAMTEEYKKYERIF